MKRPTLLQRAESCVDAGTADHRAVLEVTKLIREGRYMQAYAKYTVLDTYVREGFPPALVDVLLLMRTTVQSSVPPAMIANLQAHGIARREADALRSALKRAEARLERLATWFSTNPLRHTIVRAALREQSSETSRTLFELYDVLGEPELAWERYRALPKGVLPLDPRLMALLNSKEPPCPPKRSTTVPPKSKAPRSTSNSTSRRLAR